MISNYIIITIPQWAIFAGITVMIYGWVEKKRIFGIIGAGILVLLGIYATWAIISGALIPQELLDATDPFTDEKLFSPDELPVEGRLLPHYWGLVLSGLLALATLLSEIYHKRFTSFLKVITGILSVIIFFLMMAAIRA